MSLAEELLADLEDNDDEMDDDMLKAEDIKEEIEEIGDAPMPVPEKYDRVGTVARLAYSDRYLQLIDTMQQQLQLTDIPPLTQPLEADPQYRLIVELSQLATEIDHEINVIHKFVRDKYEKRFPELESLVPNPLDFMRAVRVLGNEITTKAQNRELMSQILLPATVMVVSVTASTTQGVALDSDELSALFEACDMAQKLHEDRMEMHRLVEQRMSMIAPNMCTLLGAAAAAAIMAQAGGLMPLCRLPACNVLLLGAQKRTLTGFSSTAVMPHTGFLYFHPFVQQLPPDLRRKGARLLAAKCTLAARVDAVHASENAEIGRNLLEQVQQKLEKLVEPPPVKHTKALPKPLDQASKKRGGRRVRKMKERLGMTELRKKANRVNFGELGEDVMQERMGFGLGQAKSGPVGGGRIRAAVVDSKSRARMSQKLQKTMEKQRAAGGITSIRSKVAGTASSVTFTPVQGLEIVNPVANQQFAVPSTSSNTYFSSTATFIKVHTPLPK